SDRNVGKRGAHGGGGRGAQRPASLGGLRAAAGTGAARRAPRPGDPGLAAGGRLGRPFNGRGGLGLAHRRGRAPRRTYALAPRAGPDARRASSGAGGRRVGRAPAAAREGRAAAWRLARGEEEQWRSSGTSKPKRLRTTGRATRHSPRGSPGWTPSRGPRPRSARRGLWASGPSSHSPRSTTALVSGWGRAALPRPAKEVVVWAAAAASAGACGPLRSSTSGPRAYASALFSTPAPLGSRSSRLGSPPWRASGAAPTRVTSADSALLTRRPAGCYAPRRGRGRGRERHASCVWHGERPPAACQAPASISHWER